MTVRIPCVAAAMMLVAACAPTDQTPFAPEAEAPPQFGPPPIGSNAPPSVAITAPSDGAVITIGPGGATVTVTADFTDPDAGDTHTCSIDWQLALAMGTVTESGGAGTCTGTFTFPAEGSYTIGVSVIDNLGGTGSDAVDITVVDAATPPSAARLHAEGTVRAVRGTYAQQPAAAGLIDFGVRVAPDQRGDALRSSVRIHLKTLGRVLRADRLESFTVTGNRAELRGTARFGGRATFPFLISVADGNQPGGDGVDRVRIVIWGDRGAVIVDTEPWASKSSFTATAPLLRGRVVLAP